MWRRAPTKSSGSDACGAFRRRGARRPRTGDGRPAPKPGEREGQPSSAADGRAEVQSLAASRLCQSKNSDKQTALWYVMTLRERLKRTEDTRETGPMRAPRLSRAPTRVVKHRQAERPPFH
jgi:hypothetical protein